MVEDPRALAEVVEQHGREDDREPGDPDRPGPKWPRSAYSASAPVTHSTTPPSARNASKPWSTKKRTPQVGDSACSTPGCAITWRTPIAAITTNHTSITGPNSQPTVPVPLRWITNSAIRITSEIGTTRWATPGVGDLQPRDGREHGDRRRDHAVAEEQRGAEDPERDQQRRVRRPCGAGAARRAP